MEGTEKYLIIASDFIKEIIKAVLGVLKIPLIFVGVLVVVVFAIPLAPFILTYFLYDRKKTHKERMKGGKNNAPKQMSVNAWANE